MELAVLTFLRTELSYGPAVWTTQYACGIFVKEDSYSNMTLPLRSSHSATAPLESGLLLGTFHVCCSFITQS